MKYKIGDILVSRVTRREYQVRNYSDTIMILRGIKAGNILNVPIDNSNFVLKSKYVRKNHPLTDIFK